MFDFSKNKIFFCLFTESLSYIAVIFSSGFRDEPKFYIHITTTIIAVRIYDYSPGQFSSITMNTRHTYSYISSFPLHLILW